MPPENGVGCHQSRDAGRQLASQTMAQFRKTPPLVVFQTQSLAPKALSGRGSLRGEKHHVVLFTLEPPAQNRPEKLKRSHG